jgi:S-(hydroxymethyl)glutathione dehydrogenase/alcohol dehydrogenase
MVMAVLAREPDAPLSRCEIDLPSLGPGLVRVRTVAAGVCHSDLSMINGTLAPRFPLVLGHEGAGVILDVGADVGRVRPGDHVVFNWAPACHRCWFCLHSQPWLCARVEGVVSTPGAQLSSGEPAHLAMGVGAFAEEVVIAADAVVPVDARLPLPIAALLGCAALTGIGAVRNTARVGAGESVLVAGLGGVGLSAVIGARWCGAGRIIAVDVNADKEATARSVGGTDFLQPGPDLAKQVRALTDGRGVDHAFDCVGSAATIRDAWRCARRGGSCTVVGIGRRDTPVEFSPLELFHYSRTLNSSVYGSGDPDRDVPMLAEQVLLGHLDLAPLVTHRIGLDGVPQAFERMRAGQGIRSVIVFDTD